jgi:hypothetical protein
MRTTYGSLLGTFTSSNGTFAVPVLMSLALTPSLSLPNLDPLDPSQSILLALKALQRLSQAAERRDQVADQGTTLQAADAGLNLAADLCQGEPVRAIGDAAMAVGSLLRGGRLGGLDREVWAAEQELEAALANALAQVRGPSGQVTVPLIGEAGQILWTSQLVPGALSIVTAITALGWSLSPSLTAPGAAPPAGSYAVPLSPGAWLLVTYIATNGTVIVSNLQTQPSSPKLPPLPAVPTAGTFAVQLLGRCR